MIARHLMLGLAGMAMTACLLLSVTAARAQEPTASETALARRQFRDGLAAAQEGNWEEARAAFQNSYELVPRPITLLNLAGALMQVGRIVEAAEGYRRFLREATEGREARLRPDAEQALAEIERRIAHVTLVLMGHEPSDQLTLDGWELSAAALGEALPVDPGEHRLVVTREGNEPIENVFSIDDGGTRTVEVDLRPERWTPREVQEQVDLTTTAQPVEPDEGGSVFASPWLWIAIGAVVAGAVVTTIVLTGGETGDPFVGNLPPFRVGVQ